MKTHQKDREIKVYWLFGGPNFEGKHNNQIGVGGRGRRDVAEEARPRWSVWGDVIALIWAEIRTTKKRNYNTPWS